MPKDYLYPPQPGVNSVVTLTADSVFGIAMLGSLIQLAGFDLELASMSGSGVIFVVGPGSISGLLVAELSEQQGAVIIVSSGNFAWSELNAVLIDGTPTNGALASLETSLVGSNNDLVFSALVSGAEGNGISVQYLAPAVAVAATVVVTGLAIVVTPATHERLLLTLVEVESTTYSQTTLIYAGQMDGKPVWTSSGGPVEEYNGSPSEFTYVYYVSASSRWYVARLNELLDLVFHAYKGSVADYPNGLTGWTNAVVSPLEVSSIAALTTSSSQVKAAFDGDTDTAGIVAVTLAPSNDGTGAVVAMAAQNLSGGSSATPALSRFMQDDDYLYSWSGDPENPQWRRSPRDSF